MLFQELNKMKRQSIMTSIALLAFGLAMIICPASYTASMIDMLGYVMVIVALVLIFNYISGKKVLINYIWLCCALVIALLGAAILVFNDGESRILHILSWTFALVLIADGIYSMIHAFVYARRAQRDSWWVLVLLALVLVACGAIILLNFCFDWWVKPRDLLMIIGIMLIFSSLVGIVRMLMTWPIRNE